MRPQDTIVKPGFDIPDLTEQQRESTGLPADFWTAFDEYFGSASIESDRLFLAGELGLRASDIEPMGEANLCWRIVDEPGADLRLVFHTYDWAQSNEVASIRLTGDDLVAAAQRIGRAPKHQRGQLERIRKGEKPVWSFLPASSQQSAAFRAAVDADAQVNAKSRQLEETERYARWAGYVGRSVEELTEHFASRGLPADFASELAEKVHQRAEAFQAAGGVEFIKTARQEIGEAATHLSEARYALGWPGADTPPRKEQ